MTTPVRLLLVAAGSYLLGCVVAAYYITRLKHGADIRGAGSGNAGARNVARVYGLGWAALTLIFDAAKGAIAVLAGLYFVGPEWAGVAALLAAIVGHIWPVQLSFHGGKGAATGLGGILVLDPLAALALLGVGAVCLAITRDFFKSGLIAIGLAAPALWLFKHDITTVAVAAVASALCLAVMHPVLDDRRNPEMRKQKAENSE